MQKQELVALRLKKAHYQDILDRLPSTFDTLGIVLDEGARDGELTVRDHGELGCVVVLGSGELGQRAARALAPKVAAPVQVYVVNGTNAGTRYRFRAAAFEATPDGHIRDHSGVELDFEDLQQTWGGGTLDARAHRVLREFGALPSLTMREKTIGYKRRAAGKPSTPRVSTLLALLKKARTWEGHAHDGGRIELRVELAAGGRQSSFCSAAEFEELKKLTGRVDEAG